MELTSDMLTWITQHANDNTDRLRFRYSADPIKQFCIMQIECRRRAAKKLPITLSNPQFMFPTHLSAEQCTSDDIASFHASLIKPDSTILDMTAGLGIDALHFASHGANVTAIDINPEIIDALTANIHSFNLTNITAICADSVDYITNTDKTYDTIFIDPARRGSNGQRLFALSDCTPNVVSLLPTLQRHCHSLIVKASPMLDIEQTLRELPLATQIYCIGTISECKEIIAICDFSAKAEHMETTICAVTIAGQEVITHSFTSHDEQDATANIAEPKVGQIFYEPYPATLKSGAFKMLSTTFGCTKLHQNTHLYTSDTIIADFPGTPYIISDIIPFTSSSIKQIKKVIPSASISVRNFILTADELRRKVKIKEDAHQRLIGTTTESGRFLLLIKPYRY
jgi:hypothetical protein